MDFLTELNEVQRSAVQNYDGASLIIAGAGSGKTRVLTYRIANMIKENVRPHTILALTFTNKAAAEVRERISKIVSPGLARSLWMGTFHSVFSRILRAEAEHLGFTASFTIYETSDSQNLVKAIIKELNLSEERYKPKDIFARISFQKNNLVTPQMYRANPILLAEDDAAVRPRFADIYREYMIRCKHNNALDFDDLLLYMNLLLRDFPEVAAKYQENFRYILVDEYQDTNFSQYLIIKKLSELHKNICVVGDDAQSIYSFRGARIENILRFKKDYPEAVVYKLEQNYRSTQTIVNAANSLIEHNKNQFKKVCFSQNDRGELIALRRAYTEKEEAMIVVSDIISVLMDIRVSPKDIAILYRTNAQSRVIEDALRGSRIPYKIYGGLSFYQRAEVKHILAYVRLVVNEKDDEAFTRIINVPARGIGSTSVGKIAALAQANRLSMWETLTRFSPEQMEIRGVAVNKLKMFRELIESMRRYMMDHNAYETVFEIASQSGLIGSYKNNPSPESQSAYQNIEELINSLKQDADEREKNHDEPISVAEWMQNIALITDMDNEKPEERNKVTLMTIHAAKGLEFKYVYIVGMEEGLFPSGRSVESLESLEEERRLFYVALTRAIHRVMVSYSLNRYRWGTSTRSVPSRFVKEVSEEYFDEPSLIRLDDYSTADIEEKPLWNREQMPRREFQPEFRKKEPDRVIEPSRYPARLKKITDTPSVGIPAGETADNIQEGSIVVHAKFGKGRVLQVEQALSDMKVTVDFDISGRKTLLLKFAKLKVLE